MPEPITIDPDADVEPQIARSVKSFTSMLGWNSVGVFDSGTHVAGDTLHVTKGTIFVVLIDPYPEYAEFFVTDDSVLETTLLSIQYEGTFEEYLTSRQQAEIYPLSAIEGIERDDHGIPKYVGTEALVGGGSDG